jgi:hypothetical protein
LELAKQSQTGAAALRATEYCGRGTKRFSPEWSIPE